MDRPEPAARTPLPLEHAIVADHGNDAPTMIGEKFAGNGKPALCPPRRRG